MREEDLQEIRQLFNEGFEKVVLPHIERIDGELAGITGELVGIHGELAGVHGELAGIHGDLQDHAQRLDRIERKLDSTIKGFDNHDIRLTRLEKHTGLR